jgi:MarR family transcriptional regulator, organic hydroperoxide resistance regulator
MSDSREDPQKLTLGHLLGQVCRLVGRRRRMKLENIGLHHAQGMLLFQLWQEEGLSQSQLALALHIRPPTATSTLRRMERDGWIERRRGESDRRVVRVYLTAKARRLRREARASFRELDREMTSLLTAQEHEILTGALRKVHRYLSGAALPGSDPSCPEQAASREREEKDR